MSTSANPKPFGGGDMHLERLPGVSASSYTGANPLKARIQYPHLLRQQVLGWYAGVDYITLTAKSGSIDWDEVVAVLAEREAHDGCGNLPQPFKLAGYVGQRIGRLSYAINPKTSSRLVRGSGALAGEVLSRFGWLADNCSRVDLQVTVQFAQDDPELAARAYTQLEKLDQTGQMRSVNGRPPIYTLWKSSNGGQTLALGKRTSRAYGRLYDKGRDPRNSSDENAFYKCCWRWEIELKDDYSRNFFLERRENHNQGEIELQQEQIVSTVFGWFMDKLVACPPLLDSRDETYARFNICDVPRELSTVEEKLRWLQKQVAPTVALLCAYGFEAEVLESLRLAVSLPQKT